MPSALPHLEFPDPGLESRYREHAARQNANSVRRAIALALLLYLVFGVLDALLGGAATRNLWLLRYALVSPLLIGGLAFTWVAPDLFERHQQATLASVSLVGGLGIVAMTAISEPPASQTYYAGLLLVLVFVHTLARLRFATASVVGLLLVIAYEIVAIAIAPVPLEVLVSNDFYLVSITLMGMLASYTLERMDRKTFLDLLTIQELSVRDPLTGLYNRRHLQPRIQELTDLFARYHIQSCLVLVDLDGFKQVNDRLGHPTGDAVLRQVARALTGCARATDLLFRYGGDEFCLLLPNTEVPAALAMMSRVQVELAGLSFGEREQALMVTLSGGCVAIDGSHPTPQQLIAAADALLLEAKRQGKRRVVARA